MRLWDYTEDDPALNLACDEALIESADGPDGTPGEVLRLWESPQLAVILGRSSKLEKEVRRDRCRLEHIPVLRRCSGGASVVIGPGCLMYTLLLSLELRPECRSISEAHCLVMKKSQAALGTLGIAVRQQGSCDLTVNDRKVSGNSLRCKRSHLLYHGTLLYDFDVDSIERYLRMPPRQPDYRLGRSHASFVANLNASKADLKSAITDQWNVDEMFEDVPRATIDRMMEEKYGSDAWHCRH